MGTRITLLYAGVFLASGAVLLVITFALSRFGQSVSSPADAPPTIADAQERLAVLQEQITRVQEEQSNRTAYVFAAALVVMALFSMVLGRLMAGHALAPLRRITEVTRRISADNLDRRLGVEAPHDEVKDLADTIDGLLARLEASFIAQRRFVANASHELRTPLATMRAALDVASAKPDPAASTLALATRLRAQLDRVDHLIDGLLVLARAQHGRPAGGSAVDLSELVATALRERAADIGSGRLTVTPHVPGGVVAWGSPALLARLVDNLVDNAVTHNEPDGRIGITVRSAGRFTELTVETDGRIFDQAEVARLGRPFERLGGDRIGSSGLGLSIVSAVVAAHQGRLRFTARPAGGLTVMVSLPADPVEAAGRTAEAAAAAAASAGTATSANGEEGRRT
ncbi:sensor histidine kinase [Actinoplanes utahensis]|uniref:sensor histidine kinase n=1 Tax=Actinoplanes utahensis TaxID=1869 RepID=UPI0007C7824C|nr:ATP-binding protein [Actinoplanes utahensis]GIF27327.1 two-component sensor histidine kinase [Actinoplanes utahensis]